MDIIVHHVDLIDTGTNDEFVASLEIIKDGESIRTDHFFPADVFETRAAEYDIPVSDFATLLDIVLYEPHLSSEEVDPATSVHYASTIDEAREAHLARIAAVKGSGKISGVLGESFDKRAVGPGAKILADSGADDPVSFIESTSLIDERYVEVKREYVKLVRDHLVSLRGEQPAGRKMMAADRSGTSKPVRRARPDAEELREMLMSTLPGKQDDVRST